MNMGAYGNGRRTQVTAQAVQAMNGAGTWEVEMWLDQVIESLISKLVS